MATHTLKQNVIGFRSGMPVKQHGDVDADGDRCLAANQTLALPDQNMTLVCLAGELWLTRDGDIEDYILGAGQSFEVRRGDQTAVQALRASRVRLQPS